MSGHRDLKIYQMAYRLATEIFNVSKTFPAEERYSLTDQIRRSSRSVAANIAEAYRKRRYPNSFINGMANSDSEATETQVWLDFAHDCRYLATDCYGRLTKDYEELGRMLGAILMNPAKFLGISESRMAPSRSR